MVNITRSYIKPGRRSCLAAAAPPAAAALIVAGTAVDRCADLTLLLLLGWIQRLFHDGFFIMMIPRACDDDAT